MERISTDALPRTGGAGSRAKAWSDIYSGMLAAAEIIPDEDDFSAGLMMSHVGPVGLARLATGRCTIHRTQAHIDASAPGLYSIIIQTRGKGLFAQSGQHAVLTPGDFALCDHNLPHMRTIERGAEMLLVRVPAEMMARYLPCPARLCGRRLPGSAPLIPTAGALARSLWQRLEMGLTSPHEDRIAHQLLELIATSYAMVYGAMLQGDAAESARFMTVQNFVEDRLHDPDFKPGSIAPQLHMDTRDVRRVFALHRESARAYVLRRRLEEAARRLRDPRWRGHTVAEIAHCCGFVSTAMFTRCFRKHYAMSPTEYRCDH